VSKRIESIEGARAVAALAVVAHHLYQQFGQHSLPPAAAHFMLWLGWWGVTFFFLLSGFCIHYPKAALRLKGDSRLDRVAFLRDRAFRIVPAFLIVLAASCVLGRYAPSNLVTPAAGWFDVAVHVLFVHNFFPDSVFSINAVLWSLGVEFQFYVLYALLYSRLAFTWRENAVLFCVGLAWYAAASVLFGGAARLTAQKMFVATFWVWHLGAVLASRYVSFQAQNSRWTRPAPGVLALALIGTAVLFHPVLARAIYWAGPFICAALLWATLPLGRAPALLDLIGRASYSLYLIHPLALAAILACHLSAGLSVLMSLTLSFALAIANYRWIELPGLALRGKSRPPAPDPQLL